MGQSSSLEIKVLRIAAKNYLSTRPLTLVLSHRHDFPIRLFFLIRLHWSTVEKSGQKMWESYSLT